LIDFYTTDFKVKTRERKKSPNQTKPNQTKPRKEDEPACHELAVEPKAMCKTPRFGNVILDSVKSDRDNHRSHTDVPAIKAGHGSYQIARKRLKQIRHQSSTPLLSITKSCPTSTF
jgi:hypothetical protein